MCPNAEHNPPNQTSKGDVFSSFMCSDSYVAFLENNFKQIQSHQDKPTRFEYLSSHIFDFTTYDGDIDELFVKKALEVCVAITNKQTFDYIKDEDNYRWFLIMCNMPFFSKKLTWGTSIRGAWWELYNGMTLKIESCGFFDGDEQIIKMEFKEHQWPMFIEAMQKFVEQRAT